MKSGVFVDGECIPESLLYRHYRQIIYPGDLQDLEEYSIFEGDAIFAGYLFDHYGHFILESISRIWLAAQHPHIPILWVGAHRYKKWQQEILELLNIKNPACFIDLPTKITGKLMIPEVGYLIQTEFKAWHNQFLSVITPSSVELGKKAWVSRSKLPHGRLINENRLEERLQENGWLIYHPQEHSVLEQVKFLSSCEQLAGLAGSAFHSLIFLKALESKIYLFSRGVPFINNQNYSTIAKVKKFTQETKYIPYAKISNFGANKDIAWANSSTVLNCLSIVHLKKSMTTPKGTHSSRRINHLARHLQAKSYLEVGVASGDTFFAVDIANKVAVDPKFRFDYRSYENESNHFFEISSDVYFTKFSNDEKFDVIFLDGLHTFEQTFRDFCSSIMVAHDKTIWILDDTMPSDVFSSWPKQMQAVNFRKQAGLTGEQWHGDVFKVVFAIHDFFPMLSYVTINTAGNPQTVVWKKAREEFSPFCNNLESISRLSYFELLQNIKIMNMTPQDSALSKVLSCLE